MDPNVIAAIIGAIAMIVSAYIARGSSSSSPNKRTHPTTSYTPQSSGIATPDIATPDIATPVSRLAKKTYWYDKPCWLVFWMAFFLPIGLYGIYRSHIVKKGWKIILSGLIPFLLSSFLFAFSAIKSTWAYQEAINLASQHPVVVTELGEPLETGFWVSGSVSISGSSGEADLSIPISGPKNKGTIFTSAIKQMGQWKFEFVELQINGQNETINLLTP